MSSMLTSQGLVLATAMAVSAGTIILFDLVKEKYFPPNPQIPGNQESTPDDEQQQVLLKSCLSSAGRKRIKKMKKKRVRFADDVRETKGNGELYRREQQRRRSVEIQKSCTTNSCGNEIIELQNMPANRAALYSGILRDRVHRMGYSC